jgi:hypothetical protein
MNVRISTVHEDFLEDEKWIKSNIEQVFKFLADRDGQKATKDKPAE